MLLIKMYLAFVKEVNDYFFYFFIPHFFLFGDEYPVFQFDNGKDKLQFLENTDSQLSRPW